MGRVPRVDIGGEVYHVINRANARMQIFFKEEEYILLEQIIESCGTDANHCANTYYIVKNNKIIFTFENYDYGNTSFTSHGSGIGFNLNWTPIYNHSKPWFDNGLCCVAGHVQTRFIYKDGKFVPLYEQLILYYKVVNEY